MKIDEMSDLISRQDVINAVTKANLQKHMDSVQDGGQENRSAIRIIMDFPTAVVVEREKGEWIEDDDATVRGHCSVCGWESHYCEDDVVGMPFCPNCGADMRGEKDG